MAMDKVATFRVYLRDLDRWRDDLVIPVDVTVSIDAHKVVQSFAFEAFHTENRISHRLNGAVIIQAIQAGEPVPRTSDPGELA